MNTKHADNTNIPCDEADCNHINRFIQWCWYTTAKIESILKLNQIDIKEKRNKNDEPEIGVKKKEE